MRERDEKLYYLLTYKFHIFMKVINIWKCNKYLFIYHRVKDYFQWILKFTRLKLKARQKQNWYYYYDFYLRINGKFLNYEAIHDFSYCLEPVLILRILIGFEALLEKNSCLKLYET